MKVSINFRCEGAAFDDSEDACGTEIARILRHIADQFVGHGRDFCRNSALRLFDRNGNAVGGIEIK